MWLNDLFWGIDKGTLLGGNYHFWVINDHFGGHCGQIPPKKTWQGTEPPFLARILGTFGAPTPP